MGLSIYFYDKDGNDVETESLSITHNLNKILIELDKIKGSETNYYKLIWRPDELFNCDNGRVLVRDVILYLPELISSIIYYQDRLEQFLPSNGYGTFEWLYDFLCIYLKECCINKDAYVYCCR